MARETERLGTEMWKTVMDYPDYLVSDRGRIRSLKGNKAIILKPIQSRKGHLYVFLYTGKGRNQKIWLHRAVLRAFVGEPRSDQGETRHLDGDPENNNLENLTWGTHKENWQDRFRHGIVPATHENPCAKLQAADIPRIRELYSSGSSSRRIGDMFGVSHTTILEIVRGNRWKGY